MDSPFKSEKNGKMMTIHDANPYARSQGRHRSGKREESSSSDSEQKPVKTRQTVSSQLTGMNFDFLEQRKSARSVTKIIGGGPTNMDKRIELRKSKVVKNQ